MKGAAKELAEFKEVLLKITRCKGAILIFVIFTDRFGAKPGMHMHLAKEQFDSECMVTDLICAGFQK